MPVCSETVETLRFQKQTFQKMIFCVRPGWHTNALLMNRISVVRNWPGAYFDGGVLGGDFDLS